MTYATTFSISAHLTAISQPDQTKEIYMALFRIETVPDDASGLYSLEVYYPDDALDPYIVTLPSFRSHEDAEQFAVEKFKEFLEQKS